MLNILVAVQDTNLCNQLAEHLGGKNTGKPHGVQCVNDYPSLKRELDNSNSAFDAFFIESDFDSSPDGVEVLSNISKIYPHAEVIILSNNGFSNGTPDLPNSDSHRNLTIPIDLKELNYLLSALEDPARVERRWLRVINDLSSSIQSVESINEVAQHFVYACIQLGFERARVYQVEDNGNNEYSLIGVAQLGHLNLGKFDEIRSNLSQAHYAKTIFDEMSIQIFSGSERGPGFHVNNGMTFPIASGEWVGIPIIVDDECVGILFIDNGENEFCFPQEQRNLLTLIQNQVNAAFSRAMLAEKRKQRAMITEFVSRVNQRATAETLNRNIAKPDLNILLHAIYEELDSIIKVHNLMIVLWDEEREWLHFRLRIENRELHQARWRKARDSGLMAHIVRRNKPLYLPNGTEKYRKQHGIELLDKPAKSWMGAPLTIGIQAIGALILESDDEYEFFSLEDYKLFQELSLQLVGAIHTAWLNEQEQQYNEKLSVLQQAGQEILALSNESEEWLWHAVLTMATADYGFGFDRAMLFLHEKGNTILRGRLGIGHLSLEAAKNASIDEFLPPYTGGRRQAFEKYLSELRGNAISDTPFDLEVRGFSVAEYEFRGAITEVMTTGRFTSVKAEMASVLLPKKFITQFGATDYYIVPLKARNRVIGILVLDNCWEQAPPLIRGLPSIDALTNEAALLYENQQHEKALIQINDLIYQSVANPTFTSSESPLSELCDLAQIATGAERVIMYTLQESSTLDASKFDVHRARNGFPHVDMPRESDGITIEILSRSDELVVRDVAKCEFVYANGNQRLREHHMLRQGIRAFIGVPVLDVGVNDSRLKGKAVGVLYFEYKTPQDFVKQDANRAVSFARLASLVIASRNAVVSVVNQMAQVKAKNLEQDAQLGFLNRISRVALEPTTQPDRLYEMLLQGIQQNLLSVPRCKISLYLREWRRSGIYDEPIERTLEIKFDAIWGTVSNSLPDPLRGGITGLALREQSIVRVPNVHCEEWSSIYLEHNDSTKSEMDVPLIVGGQAIGVVNIESPEYNAFSQEDEETIDHIVRAVSLALDNVNRRESLFNILSACEAIAANTDLDATLDTVVTKVRDIVPNLSTLTIWYKSPGTDLLQIGPNFGVHHVQKMKEAPPRRDGAVRSMMMLTEPIYAVDALNDKLFIDSDFMKREKLLSTAALPLIVNGEHVGVMFLSYRQVHQFTEIEKTHFPILASFVASGINDAISVHAAETAKVQVERERAHLEASLKVTEAIGASLDSTHALRQIALQLKSLYPDYQTMISTYHKEANTLSLHPEMREFYKVDVEAHVGKNKFVVDDGSLIGFTSQQSIASKRMEVCIIDDTQQAEHYLPVRSDSKSALAVTLMSSEGELLGAILVESPELDSFSKDDEQRIRGIAQQASIALERSILANELDFKRTVAAATSWASEIAHDLNKGIFSIRLLTKWLREENLSEQAQEYLQDLESSMEQLAVVAPTHLQEPKKIKLDSFVKQWLPKLLESAPMPVRYEFRSSTEGLVIRTLPTILQRVLRHLVRNSIQAFESSGQASGLIYFRTAQVSDELVEIVICDNGPGISDIELHRRLFNTRVTTKDSGGNGLLFVRQHMADLGGEVYLMPFEPGKGATFRLHLPITVDVAIDERKLK